MKTFKQLKEDFEMIELQESGDITDEIKDGKDRRAAKGLLNMHNDELKKSRMAKSPTKKSHHADMADQHLQGVHDILRKHNLID
jgi:hypothetical protein